MGARATDGDYADNAQRAMRLARLHRRMQYLFLGEALSLALLGVCVATEATSAAVVVGCLGIAVLLSLAIYGIAMAAMPIARVGWVTWAIVLLPLAAAIALSVMSRSLIVGAVMMWIPGPSVAMCVTHRMFKRVRAMGVRVPEFGASERDITDARLGICLACGYEVRGLPTGTCPECGRPCTI